MGRHNNAMQPQMCVTSFALAKITPEMESLKGQLKAAWMAGNYGLVAKHLEQDAEEVTACLALKPGIRLLDVAWGNGNLAMLAARAGAIATGVDIATNVLQQAWARAKSEGLAIQFDEGDAEQLPYANSAFDVVVSMFGTMFAPRPELTAAELVRVCRPDGRIAMANWTPAGFAGQMFKTVGKHVPPPPDIPSPSQWGDEAIVRERLHDGIADLQMTKRMCPLKYPFPPSDVVDFYRVSFGPVNHTFLALDADGQLHCGATWSSCGQRITVRMTTQHTSRQSILVQEVRCQRLWRLGSPPNPGLQWTGQKRRPR